MLAGESGFIRHRQIRPSETDVTDETTSEQLAVPAAPSLDWFYRPFYEDNLISSNAEGVTHSLSRIYEITPIE